MSAATAKAGREAAALAILASHAQRLGSLEASLQGVLEQGAKAEQAIDVVRGLEPVLDALAGIAECDGALLELAEGRLDALESKVDNHDMQFDKVWFDFSQVMATDGLNDRLAAIAANADGARKYAYDANLGTLIRLNAVEASLAQTDEILNHNAATAEDEQRRLDGALKVFTESVERGRALYERQDLLLAEHNSLVMDFNANVSVAIHKHGEIEAVLHGGFFVRLGWLLFGYPAL